MERRRLCLLLAVSCMLLGNFPAQSDEVNLQGLQGFGRPSYNLDSMKEMNDQIDNMPNAEKYKKRSKRFRQIGLRKEAVDDLNKALQMAPNDSVSYMLRGENYLDEGMYSEAITDLSDAIKLDPKLVEAYGARANAYNKIKEWNKAIADADTILSLKSEAVYGFVLRGAAYDGTKNYGKASADCTAAINIDPKFAKAYYYRGLAYQSQGTYQKAVDDYSQAINLQMGYRPALLGRAWSYYNLGQYEKAAADGNQAVRFDPAILIDLNKYLGEKATDPSIVPDTEYTVGAQIYDDLKNVLVLYDDVLKKDPKDSEAHRSRGLAYMHLGKYDEALKDFDAANAGASESADFPGFGLQADYTAAKASFEEGNKLLATGNYADSAAQYQAALKQYPQYGKCWHNLGIASGYLSQFFTAELCLINALSYRPNDWRLWNTLGFELFNEYMHDKGDPDKLNAARAALKRSLALHPGAESDKADVKKLLARVDSYQRALAPANFVVVTTMPIN